MRQWPAPAARGSILTRIVKYFAATAAMVGAVLGVQAAAAAESDLRPWAGPVPAFSLPDLAGRTTRLEAFRGRIVLVHFFATWCAPCRDELPALQRFAARADATRLALLVVSVAEPDDRVRRFLAAMPLDLQVLLDRDRAVSRAWDIAILPSTVVLGPDLTPRLGVEADFAWDGVEPDQLMERAARNDRSGNDQPVRQPSGG